MIGSFSLISPGKPDENFGAVGIWKGNAFLIGLKDFVKICQGADRMDVIMICDDDIRMQLWSGVYVRGSSWC